MTLDEYEILSGVKVPASRQAFVQAQLGRTQRVLETLLGYPLDLEETEETFVESGKVSSDDWPCWNGNIFDDFIWGSDDPDPDELEDPDPVEGSYRVFEYNPADKFLHIDPFVAIHKIKLVHGDVTYRTLDEDDFKVTYGRYPWQKYVNIQCGWWGNCWCKDGCLQIAVDADWAFEETPEDIQYVLSDMVTYYSDPKSNIKSESIGAHSYSRFDNLRPEEWPHNLEVLRRYAGPHGTASRTIT